jgi:hypothetical protein
MTHKVSVTLSDEEYAALARRAAESGESIEALAHEMLAQRLHTAPLPPRSMTSREFTELQYREGKIAALPERRALTADEMAERERRALLLSGGVPASEMLIEDRGPR